MGGIYVASLNSGYGCVSGGKRFLVVLDTCATLGDV
ncbi:MAG: hypothetical protein DDT38_01399 [Firmicutes bacterium]|nr:hypothetical protein [candidate division NPL-UPA2 bacterium]